MDSKININKVIFWEKVPAHYVTIEPFQATIHYINLTTQEKSIITDALVNAAHKIVEKRGGDHSLPFTWENDKSK